VDIADMDTAIEGDIKRIPAFTEFFKVNVPTR